MWATYTITVYPEWIDSLAFTNGSLSVLYKTTVRQLSTDLVTDVKSAANKVSLTVHATKCAYACPVSELRQTGSWRKGIRDDLPVTDQHSTVKVLYLSQHNWCLLVAAIWVVEYFCPIHKDIHPP